MATEASSIITGTTTSFRLQPSRSAAFRFRQSNYNKSGLLFCHRASLIASSCKLNINTKETSRSIVTHCAAERSADTGDNVDGSSTSYNNADAASNLANGFKIFLDFTVSNFLPIALVSAVALGMANPSAGCYAHKYSLSKYTTFLTFFVSGLKLKGKEIGEIAESWPLALVGLASILFFTPLFSYLILQVRLSPQEFVTGLAIFCCVPTTLTSGVALTQLVGGNTALALAMTVISNLLGVLTVPFLVSRIVADGFGLSIPTGKLFWSLIFTLLLPLVLGKVVRDRFKGIANYIDQNSRTFSVINTFLLSLTPWTQVSKSRPLLLMVKPQVFIEAIGMGMSTRAWVYSYGHGCMGVPARKRAEFITFPALWSSHPIVEIIEERA
ncbi:probable sodium/metabolite cotransporter BASS4, chloroplastic isoform X2 [Mercurialis annua]|uniref:probable sodium/metabolite cotransporter BASS4, chloroplastic isoform X2 n=1 Tax=Mercurialis annua TaxID=3986 RepID=UPI00215DDD06|nr:probable sodium/metabolite cotransporter BASS4, chloroplastic isoform X2 [Mercurialis annua]